MYQKEEFFDYEYDPSLKAGKIILDIGEYDFIVKGAYPDKYYPGKISLKLFCKRNEQEGIVYHKIDPMSKDLFHFVNSIGRPELYNESGRLWFKDVLNETGVCDLGHWKDKNTGQISKNIVTKLKKKELGNRPIVDASSETEDDGWPTELKGPEPEKQFDDDIPF